LIVAFQLLFNSPNGGFSLDHACSLPYRPGFDQRIPTAQGHAEGANEPSRPGIQQLKNKCSAPVPLRTVGSCDPFAQGYEPTPGTYVLSPMPVAHRLAA
ncbi:hypothetical protein ABZ741_35850, partial [Streptomyces globisporus]